MVNDDQNSLSGGALAREMSTFDEERRAPLTFARMRPPVGVLSQQM
jgi:hypothetical protein